MNVASLFKPLTGFHPNSVSRRAANSISLALSQQYSVVVDHALLSGIDRAWRKVEAGNAIIAPHYARALYGRLEQNKVPLQLTYVLAHQSEDVIAHCVHVSNLILNGKYDWALKYAAELLTAFATDSDPLFPHFLDSFTTALSMAGWAGYNAGWQIEASNSDCAAAFKQNLLAENRSTMQHDRIFGSASTLSVTGPGFDAGAIIHPSLALTRMNQCDGRARWVEDKLTGWFSYRRAPLLRPKIVMTDEADNIVGFVASVRQSYAHWGFSTRLLHGGSRKSNRSGDWLHVRASLTGVGQLTFPASPIPTRSSRVYLRQTASARRGPSAGQITATATVVVPVFNNLSDSLRCLNALATALPPGWNVIVVDDGSTEVGTSEHLAEICQTQGFDYYRNPINEGYSRSVNKGMQSTCNDVVLLNSDTVIFRNVLADLAAVAGSATDIATVTAPSTDQSIAGIGLAGKDEPSTIRLAAAINDNLLGKANTTAVEVPTGVGHCMYIKRAALNQVGLFDAAAFPGGYGEETDFCFRASLLGWRHVISTGSFLYHAGGRSFASRRLALMERAETVMVARYPAYLPSVRTCVADPVLRRFKRSINEYLLRTLNSPLALIVGPKLGGGVDRAISSQIAQLAESGTVSLVLHPATTKGSGKLDLQCSALPGTTLSYGNDELEILEELIAWMGVASVHIHHFVGVPRRLLNFLADQYGERSTIYIHDYSWACPRLNLLGPSGKFCNTPPIKVCNSCINQQGSLLSEHLSVSELRHTSAQLFNRVAAVKTVSADIKKRLNRMLDLNEKNFDIHELEKDARAPKDYYKTKSPKKPVRVAIMGAIGIHKGYDVIFECLSDAQRRSLAIEYSLIGFSSDDSRLQSFANFTCTGPYKEHEAEYLLRGEQADIFFCSSIVPESWCYTLSYALKIGMPVVSFAIGAQAERLKKLSQANLVPLGTHAKQLNNLFIKISRTSIQ